MKNFKLMSELGGFMKKFIMLFIIVSSMYARNCIEVGSHGEWCFDQGTDQAFYMLESVTIDSISNEASDIIGVFVGETCIGFITGFTEFITVPVMGSTGGISGLATGEVPDQLLIYDSSNDSILPLSVAEDLAPFEAQQIFVFSNASANNIFGCTDESACNFNDDATADDGNCLENDCAGSCGGSAVVDECGICDGSGIADGECDCDGNVLDCAGECGGLAEEDLCGECNGDDLSCLGCTTVCADNYDSDAEWDNGEQCIYTVDPVSFVSANPGQGRVTLTWNSPNLMCEELYTFNVYDLDGNFVKETSNNTTQVTGLIPNIEACFNVTAQNIFGESSPVAFCAVPDPVSGCISSGLQLSASINGWGTFEAVDTENFLGVGASSTYGYDSANNCDTPEPPVGVGNYISLYFPHEEWETGTAGDRFTQDIVLEDADFFEHNLTRWYIEVVSNMAGEASVTFNNIETPFDVPMFVQLIDFDDDSEGDIYPITNGSSVEFYLTQGNIQKMAVYIGNIPPTVNEDALSAVGGDRSIDLSWTASEDLHPATSYTIYREEADAVELVGLSYTDSEDRLGHDGQGLLYESDWNYTLTASNAAGESTEGFSIRESGGQIHDIEGTSSHASGRTNNNLDPVAIASHVLCEDFSEGNESGLCEGDDGNYNPVHSGSDDENELYISVDGDLSYDEDQFDKIDRHDWILEGQQYAMYGSHENSVPTFFQWKTGNVHGAETKDYTATIIVFSDYPTRDGIATRSDTASIDVKLAEEPNIDPEASNGLSLIVAGDGLSVSTMDEFSVTDSNDYDSNDQYWYVPHDGEPSSVDASVHFDAEASSDDDSDELHYKWRLYTGVDANWSFTDLNDNEMYDLGEPVHNYGGGQLYDQFEETSSSMTYSDNLPADVYIVEMIVTDTYQDSDTSAVVVGILGERNNAPSSNAGEDQAWYMEYDLDQKSIVVNDNSGSDSDNDALSFSWSVDGFDSEGDSNSGWRDLIQDLPEGQHTFTFTVTDSYNASASDEVVIDIRHEPDAPAVATIDVTHTDLKYAIIEWAEGELNASDYIVNGVQAYTGTLNNTKLYELYRNGELIESYSDDDEENSSYTHIDQSLTASTQYTYEVRAFNSDNSSGASKTASTVTHDRPTVAVLNPNGNEILSVGDEFVVEFSTTNPQYIHQIDLYYGNDGSTNGDIKISSSNGNTTSFTIMDDNGVEVSNDAAVRVVVTDVGDYNGNHKDTNEDSSDHSFTMAAHSQSNQFPSGWSLFGSPLNVDDSDNGELIEDNFASLDASGPWWVYDSDRRFTELSLNVGEGYYLLLNNPGTLSIEDGDPITGDPDSADDFSDAKIVLEEGWNLIANPLVIELDKSNLTVTELIDSANDTSDVFIEGETYSWYEAVDEGLVAPTINGWFGDSHFAYDNLQPWAGYWINTSTAVSVNFRPIDPSIENVVARKSDSNDLWDLTVKASDVGGQAAGDYITIGLSENANSKFTYGEDEFDLPRPAVSSLVDLHIDNKDWIGTRDRNNIMVSGAYFYKDIRSYDYNLFQAWNISAENYNVENILLEWDAPIELEDNIHLVINEDIIDMKAQTSIEVSNIKNAAIVVGDVDSFINPIPEKFGLSSAYPNPFNPTTNLNLDLSDAGQVSVKVYNVMGQVVSDLINGYMDAGFHKITWQAKDVASGMYFVRVEAGTNIATQKIMLLK